jgi:hypothetical protein
MKVVRYDAYLVTSHTVWFNVLSSILLITLIRWANTGRTFSNQLWL